MEHLGYTNEKRNITHVDFIILKYGPKVNALYSYRVMRESYCPILTITIPTVLVSVVGGKVPGVSQSKPILSPLHQPWHLPHPAGQHYLHSTMHYIVYSVYHSHSPPLWLLCL